MKRIFFNNNGLGSNSAPNGFLALGFNDKKLSQIDDSGSQSVIGYGTSSTSIELSYNSYESIVSQYASVSLSPPYDLFRIGDKYMINLYAAGDDLSDVGGPTASDTDDVYNDLIFTATNRWSRGFTNSSITSLGTIITDEVLENGLGFDLDWNTDVKYHYFDFPKPQIEDKVVYTKIEDEKGTGYSIWQHFGFTHSLEYQPSAYVNSILLHSSGSIIIGGGYGVSDGKQQYDFPYIKKLDSNGSPTSSWSYPELDNDVDCMIELQDGSILVGGQFTGALRKYDIDGNEDTTFTTNLGSILNSSSNGRVQSLVELSDGKILVAGTFDEFNGRIIGGIVRINANGTDDTTFNSGGSGITGGNGAIKGITVDAEGKIIIGGNFFEYNGLRARMFCRLNNDGTYDSTFMDNLLEHHYGMFNNTVVAIIEHLDGYILGGKFTNWGVGSQGTGTSVIRARIIRIKKDGTEDSNFYFNMNGDSITIGDQGFTGQVNCFATQSNGGIIVGGQMTSACNGSKTANYIARLKSDGRIDDTFNESDGFDNTVNTIVTSYESNEIWVGGYFINTVSLKETDYLCKMYSPTRLGIPGENDWLRKSRLRFKVYK